MVFQDRKSVVVTPKNFTISVFLCILFLIVCGCSSARDVKPVTQLAISPDGKELIFRYEPEKGDGKLVRFNTITGALQAVPQPDDEVWCNPTYSTDGKWLAVGVYAVDAQRVVQYSNSRVDVMHADGSERRTVVPQDGLIKSIFKFSPDGKRLLFAEGSKGRLRPSGFTIHEVNLQTLAVSPIAMANFYQLSSLDYLNNQFAFAGYAPRSYLDSASPVPDKYIPTASEDKKNQWAMERNSMMYVTDEQPRKLAPYVTFETGDSIPAWSQNEQIEALRVAAKDNRVYVAMRHSQYPKDKDLRHFIRDIFEMNPDRTFRRLTFFNTVQFHGFDVTPDGRFVVVVPDNRDDPARSASAIYRIDTTNGETKVFEPDFSKLSTQH